eukprot:gene546-1202_t
MKMLIGSLFGMVLLLNILLFCQAYKIVTNGNLTLGGIFNVRMKGNIGRRYWPRCGEIEPQYGVMFVEAMLFAIDQLNKNSSYLYGLKIAAQIHDTCGDRYYQRSALVEIINKRVHGIIGPQSSDSAETAATVFDIFGRSIISYSASSPDLESRKKYRFFYRTVPPDRKTAELLVNIALRLEWRYVAVIYSSGSYGESISAMFETYANQQGICTPVVTQMAEDAPGSDFIHVMDSIIKYKTIKVVYLLLTDSHIKEFFDSTENSKAKYEHLQFVIGNKMGSRVSLTKGRSLANGSLSIQVAHDEVLAFREYFLKLRPETNKRNIWFKEFWENTFNCSLTATITSNRRLCNASDKLADGRGYYKMTPVLNVINGVYAYAHVFRKMLNTICIAKNKTVEQCYPPGKRPLGEGYEHWEIIRVLQKISFKEPFRDRMFYFDSKGSNNEDFAILNLRVRNDFSQEFHQVGLWNNSEHVVMANEAFGSYGSNNNIESSPAQTWRLSLDVDKIHWSNGRSSVPVSVCSEACKFGEVRRYLNQATKCCWVCTKCKYNDVIVNNTCIQCSMDSAPDVATRAQCRALPVYYTVGNKTLVIVVATVTSLGLALTLFVIGLFLKYAKHRVIKASGRELCLNMLIGIAATYLAAVTFILQPSKIACNSQRFVVGLSLTITYAPLLLKTNRIYRIFRSAQSTVERPSMVSPRSQIIMSLALTAVQILIGLVSINGNGVKISTAYPSHRQYVLQFCELSNETVFMNLSFSTALMIATTWFAFKTRNFPKNYNEAKYIGFTMYTTCLALAVFLPIFHFVDNKEGRDRMIIMCCLCEIVATINLTGLFGHKVKFILNKNQRNIDANMTTMRSSCSKMHNNNKVDETQRAVVLVDTWTPKSIEVVVVIADNSDNNNRDRSLVKDDN